MRYNAVEFEIGPETLSRIGDDWLRRWQETVDDAQDTFTKAVGTANPVDAWSLQLSFGMRNAQRWLGWADWQNIAAEAEQAAEPEAEAQAATAPADAPPPVAPEFLSTPNAPAPAAEPAETLPLDPPRQDAAEKTEPAPAEVAAAETAADELQRIRGIGPAIEAKLNARGITSFRQMAALDDEAIAELDAALDLKGRIERDGWIDQAANLAGKA
jgi:predicted flap endonuclease-1-like 5' DNA nuclease